LEIIPIIRPQGSYVSRDREIVYDCAGRPYREISFAPSLLITQCMRELSLASTQTQEDRLAAIARAGALFSQATLEGESPQDYCLHVAQVSGTPIAVIQRSLTEMSRSMQELAGELEFQQPRGATTSLTPLRAMDAPALWLPRGKTLAVIAAGNHPMIHVSWLQALAFGYHVAIRPGRRDPFTPLRLIRSLLTAGLAPGHLAFLPGTHHAVECLIDAADFALVYGDESVVNRYAQKKNVLLRGPGHSKLLIEKTRNLEDAGDIDMLVQAVAADGGVRCTNTSALLIGENTADIAHRLADRLSRLPVLPVTEPAACLPVMPREQARNIRTFLDRRLEGAIDLCCVSSSTEAIVDLDDGAAVLKPAVLLCQTSCHPFFGCELPFPCVWIAPWSAQDGVVPLRNSLVVTMLTNDELLVRDALNERSIRKVCWGPISPCFSASGVPHDGYIGQFLMEAKGFVHSPQAEKG
jgi:acyl-CoA reductase-like NAD-dependent aldehyde dehydrogenase